MAEIGQTLREARIRARIDISEVETRTKIRAKYLRAIENEEFELLPGPVYAKSFLRSYADYLGLDSRLLLDEYRRRYERPSDHELRPIAPLGRERERDRRRPAAPRGPLVPPWAIIAIVLVAVVAVLAVIGSMGGTGRSPAPTGLRGGGGTRTHTRRRHRAVARSTRPPVTRPAHVTLVLVPTGAVYVCLVDGSGRMLIPGVIYNAGQTIPVERAQRMLLTLGNANVTMKVNGRPVAVTPSATSIGYRLTPSAVTPLAPSAQPRCA